MESRRAARAFLSAARAMRLAALAALFLFALIPHGAAAARDLSSRLGAAPAAGQATQPAAPVAVPVELLILSEAGPLAADGAGRLFMLGGEGGGYDLLRLDGDGMWQTVYRSKSGAATSLAVGWDGTICVGLLSGVDCVDPQGRVTHHSHELLKGIVSLAIAPDGHVWALRSASGGTAGLELVRAAPGFAQVSRVLTLRQSVQGFAGNGLAAAADGSVVMPVIENDVYRVFRVQPDGRFARAGDFWRLGGGIAVAQAAGHGERLLLGGTKRPQSVEEQRNPVDVVYALGTAGASEIAASFPQSGGGSAVVSSYSALGGDGSLYMIRRQRVRAAEGPAVEAPVLWRVPVGAPSVQGRSAAAIEFSIPHIASLAGVAPAPAGYAGPLLVARGEPLVIEGINFHGKQGVRQVLVGGVRALVESWSGDRIVVRVPAALGGGPAEVRVAIDQAASDPESFEVKTPGTPGWFQIGSEWLQAALANNSSISGYTGLIEIVGATELGEAVYIQEEMEAPGLYYARLPNGLYKASFAASYLYSEVMYGNDFTYAGSRFVPVRIEEQSVFFTITDDEPVVVWTPEML